MNRTPTSFPPEDVHRGERRAGERRLLAFVLVATLTAAPALGQAGAAAEPLGAPASALQHIMDDVQAHRDAAAAAGGAPGAVCVELSMLSVMFEPDATDAQIEAALANAPAQQFEFFLAQGSRWTTTATDGTVGIGDPMTITYSFVPDGTLIPGSGGEADSPSNLFAVFDANFPGGRAAWKAKFAAMFARWGELSNLTFVEVDDDGAAFPSSPGLLGGGGVTGRGDIRLAMHPIGAGPLAYNFFPQFGGDMVLDSLDIGVFTNPASSFRRLFNTLAHETGHGLGLNHVEPQSGTKLMEPVLNTAFNGPQEDDIRGVQFLYGDAAERNDSLTTAGFVGGPLRDPASEGEQTLTVDEVALERDGAADFYSFTAFASVPIAIRVEPLGTTYSFGAQGSGTTSTVNAKAARNLGLRLWRRTSAQDNTFALVAQINFNEAGLDEYHPPIAYTLAGFMVAEVYSNDGVDDVQRYRLTISNSSIESEAADPDMVVVDGLTLINDGDLVLFDQAEIGENSGKLLTIRNDGAGPLVFNGAPTVNGPGAADFELGGLPAEVAPGTFAVLSVTFAPVATGERVAVLSIPSNDPDAPDFSFIIRGTGLEPSVPEIEATFDGAALADNDTLDLGEFEVGESVELDLVLRNTGNASLTVLGTSRFDGPSSDEFEIVSGVPVTIAPNQSRTVTVSFTASASGARQAQLKLFNNSAINPLRLNFVADVLTPITDCNGNGVDDAQDIATGASLDCDGNGLPDECEADSDGDGIIDACDACPQIDNRLDSDGDGVNDCEDAFPNDPTNGQPPNDPNEPVVADPNVVGADPNEPIEADPNLAVDPNDPRIEEPEIVIPGLCGFGVLPMMVASLLALGGHKRATRRPRA